MLWKRRLFKHAIILFVATLCIYSVFGEISTSDEQNSVQERRRPVTKFTVASPRATLVGPPRWSVNCWYQPSGDAENFARGHGSLRVPLGTRVVFCLSREIEGVWYSGTYGMLGTSLVLQWARYYDTDPAILTDNQCTRCICDQCTALGIECDEPDATALDPCPWVTIGRDGARDVRKGPSIGRAKVGVPVHFRRPGVFYLRAIVRTFAQPYYPRPIEAWRDKLLEDPTDAAAILPPIPMAQDIDVVYIRVRVVDLPIDQVEPDDEVTVDPDVDNITPMPKDIDPNAPDPDPAADLNGDDVVNLGDLAILSQQWGSEYVMPLKDDE